jgi:hypothetical protein
MGVPLGRCEEVVPDILIVLSVRTALQYPYAVSAVLCLEYMVF